MAGFRPRGTPEVPDLDLGPIEGKTTGTRPTSGTPELDLDVPAPSVKPSVPAPTPSGRSVLDDFEDDDAGHAPLALEIDTSGSAPLPPAVSAPPPPVSQRSLPPTGVPVSVPPGDRTSMPVSGPVSMDGPIAVDPYDARARADYEPEPDAFYMTPLYAWKVMQRKGELKIELDQAREKSERMANEALDALVTLGERLVPLATRGLEQVQAAEQVLRTRDGALAGEMDAHKQRLAEIDARLAAAEQELAAINVEQGGVQAELDEAKAGKARVEAKMKRAEIEMRNAEAIGTELDLRPSQSSADDLTRANAQLAAVEVRFAEARRKTAAAEARVTGIRGERKSETDRFGRQLQTRTAGFTDAREGYRRALADLAAQMIAGATLPPDLEPLRKDAVASAERAHKAAIDLRLLEVGIDSFDKSKVATGIGLAAGLIFLLVIAVLFPFIYRAFVNG